DAANGFSKATIPAITDNTPMTSSTTQLFIFFPQHDFVRIPISKGFIANKLKPYKQQIPFLLQHACRSHWIQLLPATN
ncbi:MAG TPA: hypothetical protein VM011_14120, partial [Gammaproteobacteria bacterium]|nr:hypothetical protein [Gammaproteobacteria bacterium]